MPSAKRIRRRIISVSKTQQIMRAMNLVAATKLQTAREQLVVARDLFSNLVDTIGCFRDNPEAMKNRYVAGRRVRNIAYLVITSDRGLCGGYNTNIIDKSIAAMAGRDNEHIIALGMQGWDHFIRTGQNVVRGHIGMTETVYFDNAERVGDLLLSLYTLEKVDEAYIIYTHFNSALSCEPKIIRVLPICSSRPSVVPGAVVDLKQVINGRVTDDLSAAELNEDGNHSVEPYRWVGYEPDVNTFLSAAIQYYITAVVYYAMVESSTSENASRMVSMDNAEKSADDVIEKLTLLYNRDRKNRVTREIIEIVSGANALQPDD